MSQGLPHLVYVITDLNSTAAMIRDMMEHTNLDFASISSSSPFPLEQIKKTESAALALVVAEKTAKKLVCDSLKGQTLLPSVVLLTEEDQPRDKEYTQSLVAMLKRESKVRVGAVDICDLTRVIAKIIKVRRAAQPPGR